MKPAAVIVGVALAAALAGLGWWALRARPEPTQAAVSMILGRIRLGW